jgi:endo-1,4-beta-D-glucanase Y
MKNFQNIVPAISLCFFLITLPSLVQSEQIAHPFPQHISYAPGTILPAFSRNQLDNDVKAYYAFWKSRYLVSAGTSEQGLPLYRVSYGSTNPARTVSEGQGYGMMIVAIMAGFDPEAQSLFDGLWRFSRQHPSHQDHRLMAWEVPENPVTGIDAAFDGDADMAHALFLAAAQWGENGSIKYRQEGETLITAIAESMVGAQSHLPMLGDWVEQEGVQYNQYTPRSSDFMPDHFSSWFHLTGNILWKQIADTTRQTITDVQQTHSQQTGLLPDFLIPNSPTDHRLHPAPANFLEGPNDGHYEYNAGRVPWRIGTDALLNNNSLSRSQAIKMADWIYKATQGDPANIHNGYTLDGTPLNPGDDFTIFFAAPFGVAMMLRPAYQNYLNRLYTLICTTHEDYYEDTVTLLSLLVMTGNYWDPASFSGNAIPAVYYLLLK